MKLDMSDGLSNNSDFSNDSQNSQMSGSDYVVTAGTSVITPTTVSNIIISTINSI